MICESAQSLNASMHVVIRTYVVSSVRSENLLYSLIPQMLIIPARALAIFNLYQQGCVRVVSDRVLPAQAELFTQKI